MASDCTISYVIFKMSGTLVPPAGKGHHHPLFPPQWTHIFNLACHQKALLVPLKLYRQRCLQSPPLMTVGSMLHIIVHKGI